MTDEHSTFETTKARLEDIVTQVRRKDVSLEASLDLLEEAVRLVNQCNDLIDQTSWRASQVPTDEAAGASAADSEDEAIVSGGAHDDVAQPSDPAGGTDDTPEPDEPIEDDARE